MLTPLSFFVAVSATLDFEQSVYSADEFNPVQVCVVTVGNVDRDAEFSLITNAGTAESTYAQYRYVG